MYRLTAYDSEQHPIDGVDNVEIINIDRVLVARVSSSPDDVVYDVRAVLRRKFPDREILVVTSDVEFLSLKEVPR